MDCDFLVIGAGVAGLRAAIELARCGSVLVIAKDSLRESLGICAGRDCGMTPLPYVVASGTGNSVVFPLAKLLGGASEDRIAIADRLGGRPLPNGSLRVFPIENERVTDSVVVYGGLRLVSPR